jgi:hypothetical protein
VLQFMMNVSDQLFRSFFVILDAIAYSYSVHHVHDSLACVSRMVFELVERGVV